MATRTITLTQSRPVKIDEDKWPIIANGTIYDHDGEIRAQANSQWEVSIEVRQHADGRTIVYGVYDFQTNFRNVPDLLIRSGYLLDSDRDVVETINQVAGDMRIVDGTTKDWIDRARRECIANLPAVEL